MAYDQSLTGAYLLARMRSCRWVGNFPLGGGAGGNTGMPVAGGLCAWTMRTGDCRSFLPPTGGFCGVASAFACVDFFFDFIALRGRIGADGAYAVAAITFCPSQPRSHAGSASTFAIRRWGGTAGDRPGSRTGTGSGGYGASDHQGHRTEA